MVKRCIAFGCSNKSSKPECRELSWHLLPLSNKKLLTEWLVKTYVANILSLTALKSHWRTKISFETGVCANKIYFYGGEARKKKLASEERTQTLQLQREQHVQILIS